MKTIQNKNIEKSDHVVIRKVIVSFMAMMALLLVSNATMSYVASRGVTNSAETVLTADMLRVIEPLAGLSRSIRSLTAMHRMISFGSTEDSVRMLDQLSAEKIKYTQYLLDLEKMQFAEDSVNLAALKIKSKAAEVLGSEMALAYVDGNVTKGKELGVKVEAVAAELESEITDIINKTSSKMITSGKQLLDFFKMMRMVAFVLMGASAVFAGIIIVLIVKGIRNALEIEQVKLKERVMDIVRHLSDNTKSLLSTSVTLNESNEKLASSSDEQTQTATRVVEAVKEMSAMVQETFRHAQTSSGISEKSQNRARSGRSAVQKMSDSMTEIQLANKKLTEIVDLMSEVTAKTNVINDIVFQTRLLSFNASVEAARAGEHGKGFSVVANEIGKLALQSGESAEAINQLLIAGNQKVNSVVKDIQLRTDAAGLMSEECVGIFSDMEALNNELNMAITQITSATNEIKVGIEHTASSITQIDQAINFNSQITRDSQARAMDVKNGSDQLSATVYMLKEIVE